MRRVSLLAFWGFARAAAQPLEQPGREMSKGRRNRPRVRADHNGRSINGAYPARLGEPLGCKTSIAPLQALDASELRSQQLEVGVFVEKPGDGFGHWGHEGGWFVHYSRFRHSRDEPCDRAVAGTGAMARVLHPYLRILPHTLLCRS